MKIINQKFKYTIKTVQAEENAKQELKIYR